MSLTQTEDHLQIEQGGAWGHVVLSPVLPNTRIQLLGCFGLTSHGAQSSLPLQAQRVLAYLAVIDSQVDRQQLAGRLWPYTKDSRAQGNLRTALWRIRQEAPDAVVPDRRSVGIGRRVEVDYRSLLTPSTPMEGPIGSAALVGLLRHELLPGWDEDWLIVERERTRQLRMRRLEALGRESIRSGNLDDAICAAYAAIDIEPLRETAHLVLIEAHVADGNLAEAMRQSGRITKELRAELGINPSADFRQRLSELGLCQPPD